MASAFHLFSALPTELRLQIWKDAIRPRLRAAHIVRVHSSDVPNRPQNTILFKRDLRVDQQLSRPSGRIAIPSRSRYLDGNDHGSDFDISAYLIDAGLWTACRESRLMMQESFLYREWHYGPWVGYHISGGAPLYITIRSNDLVILQPDELSLGSFDDETLGRLHELDHIGIEYRPEWGMARYEEDEESEQAFGFADILGFADVMRYATCVWLIDHNLRRKVDAPPYVEGCTKLSWITRNVSFWAADRKFPSIDLETKNEDPLTHWEYINPVADGDHQKSSLHFADRMHKEYVNRQVRMQVGGPQFGLLGWDHL